MTNKWIRVYIGQSQTMETGMKSKSRDEEIDRSKTY